MYLFMKKIMKNFAHFSSSLTKRIREEKQDEEIKTVIKNNIVLVIF